MDIDDLDLYYEDCVIGGPGSFVVDDPGPSTSSRRPSGTKLVLEVAGRTPERPVVPAAGREAARQLHGRREDLAGPVGKVAVSIFVRGSFLPSPGGGGSASIARCSTGWGDSLPADTAHKERLPPHPAAPFSRVDPPPPGEGEDKALTA